MCIWDDLSFSDPFRCVREGDLSPSDPSMSVGNGSVFFIRIFMNGMGELSRGMGTGESQIHTGGDGEPLWRNVYIFIFCYISLQSIFPITTNYLYSAIPDYFR